MLGAFMVAQMVKNVPAMQESQDQSLGQEDPLEKGWQPTPVFWPGGSHGQRSLVGYSPWALKESDTTKQLTHTHTHTHTHTVIMIIPFPIFVGFYRFISASQVALVVKNPPANAGDLRDVGSSPGSVRSPIGGHGSPPQYTFPGESHGQGNLAGYSP